MLILILKSLLTFICNNINYIIIVNSIISIAVSFSILNMLIKIVVIYKKMIILLTNKLLVKLNPPLFHYYTTNIYKQKNFLIKLCREDIYDKKKIFYNMQESFSKISQLKILNCFLHPDYIPFAHKKVISEFFMLLKTGSK